MKILQAGKLHQWEEQKTCTGAGNGNVGCYALLLVNENDLFTTESNPMGRDPQTFITFECPCCNALTDIDDYRGRKTLPTREDWLIGRGPEWAK